MGLREPPTEAKRCIACHTTWAPDADYDESYQVEEGVTCGANGPAPFLHALFHRGPEIGREGFRSAQQVAWLIDALQAESRSDRDALDAVFGSLRSTAEFEPARFASALRDCADRVEKP